MRKDINVVIVVMTAEMATVKAIMGDGRSFIEEYGRTSQGEADYRKGNFEDEPELEEELMHALCGLQEPVLKVMEQIQEKGEGK